MKVVTLAVLLALALLFGGWWWGGAAPKCPAVPGTVAHCFLVQGGR